MKNKKIAQSSLLTLQEFYDFLHPRNVTSKEKSLFNHNYLIVISPWKEQNKSSIQSTLTSHHSGSTSVLSTSSVSSSSCFLSNTVTGNYNLDSSIFSISAVERNPKIQMYRIFGLGKDDHFFCDDESFDILKAIPPLDSTSRNFIIVPRTQEVYNSTSMTVVNSVSNPNPSLDLVKTLAQANSFLSKTQFFERALELLETRFTLVT